MCIICGILQLVLRRTLSCRSSSLRPPLQSPHPRADHRTEVPESGPGVGSLVRCWRRVLSCNHAILPCVGGGIGARPILPTKHHILEYPNSRILTPFIADHQLIPNRPPRPPTLIATSSLHCLATRQVLGPGCQGTRTPENQPLDTLSHHSRRSAHRKYIHNQQSHPLRQPGLGEAIKK
jgi:hypothetical protein